MNKRERLNAALKKQPVDRPPIALWRHFPQDDIHPERFAQRVIAFQKRWDFDLCKVTPVASYLGEMYGATLRYANNREGTREQLTRAVKYWHDWARIEPLEASHPVIQRERESIRLIRAALGPDVPILQTLFSPLSAVRTLAGDRFVVHLREHPDDVHRALDALRITTERFAAASIEAGADALFMATQVASHDLMTHIEWQNFEQAHLLPLLNALHERVDLILLHAHGENILFDELSQLPVEVINWHDRKTPPTLRQGKAKFGGAVAGGIDEWDVLAAGTPEQIKAQVQDAVAQTGGTGLIIAAGCVIPIDTPEANIQAAREAVDSL